MASNSMPSTPKSQLIRPDSIPPSPGSWRHPALDEIQRRRHASTFGERQVTILLWNIGCLLGTWLLQVVISTKLAPYVWGYVNYVVLLFRALLVYNIGIALFPLVQRKDEMLDIPLTPGQRALLGLDPTATPPLTPGQQYVTPPRYQRSRGGTPVSARRSLPGSPLAGRDSSRELSRELSLGSPGPAGRSDSPKASVQANSRWLYKKGMESSRALYLL